MAPWNNDLMREYAETKGARLERMAEEANRGRPERPWLIRALKWLRDRWKHAKGS
jgi:hypothetical protein